MDWQKATWISGDTSCTAPMFRQDFAVEALEKATIISCGLGFFELYLNGARVGDDLFVPVWSNYEKRENRRLLYPLLVSARSKGPCPQSDNHHSFSDVEHQLTKKIDFKVFSSSKVPYGRIGCFDGWCRLYVLPFPEKLEIRLNVWYNYIQTVKRKTWWQEAD